MWYSTQHLVRIQVESKRFLRIYDNSFTTLVAVLHFCWKTVLYDVFVIILKIAFIYYFNAARSQTEADTFGCTWLNYTTAQNRRRVPFGREGKIGLNTWGNVRTLLFECVFVGTFFNSSRSFRTSPRYVIYGCVL